MNGRGPRQLFAALARRATSESNSGVDEAGFSLVELVIVIAIMPLVVGALAVGIISVLSLQTTVSNRLSDSTDAEVVSVHFQDDLESAQMLTTASSPTSAPAACGSGFQILGLQLGNGTEVSYSTIAGPKNSANLVRNICSGSNKPISLPLAHDLPSSALSASPVTFTCGQGSTGCEPVAPTNTPAYQLGWVSALGVTVTLKTTEPLTNYTYQAVGVPTAAANSTNLSPVGAPSTGCNFATPGTGLASLCFVDFTPWDAIMASGPPSNPNCASGQLYMSAGITNTAYTLSFCMTVTSAKVGNQSISGYVSQANNGCGVANRAGWDDIDAVALPTYACPPGSEAFLGNNGFYTGIQGDPALYTVEEGSTVVVSFTNIKVLTSSGGVASGWKLATGDAESTDQNESITWQSNENLALIPNSASSPVGNACMSFGANAPPNYNTTQLSGIGTGKVECSSTVSADHTGTPMLYATQPSSLTVTLVGTGLQAVFLGVELS